MQPQYICTHITPAMHAFDPIYEGEHVERIGYHGRFTVSRDGVTPAGQQTVDHPYFAVTLGKILPASGDIATEEHRFNVLVCFMGDNKDELWVPGVVLEFGDKERNGVTFSEGMEQAFTLASKLNGANFSYTEYQDFCRGAIAAAYNLFFVGEESQYRELVESHAKKVVGLLFPPEGEGRPGDATLQ